MSFAQEVGQAKQSAKAPVSAQTEVAKETPAQVVETLPQGSKAQETPAIETALPKDGDIFIMPDDPKAPKDKAIEPKKEAVAEKKQQTEAKKAPIKIGTREFEDINDAVEYAKELETARIADQAYIEGVKAATPKPADKDKPAEQTAYEKFSNDVFIDPVKAAKEFSENIKNELRQEYSKSVTERQQAEAVQKARNEAWEGFFKDNPDLSDPETRELVQNYVYNKHIATIGPMKPKEGLEKLAELSRKTLKISKEAALPSKELPSGPVTTTGASESQGTVTTNENNEPELDFVSQVRNMRKKK